ncbi:hypothetical protein EVAR_10156_1 [Eumeta japonica]|uniref:Uncharacterized protein n=1 Tax=Eumeta variegata TaxID=151549 RepID=A0A4C1UC74_EUMVA|nr:hypothetical protein EVAR_10156_1 [Eumeta japonica]
MRRYKYLSLVTQLQHLKYVPYDYSRRNISYARCSVGLEGVPAPVASLIKAATSRRSEGAELRLKCLRDAFGAMSRELLAFHQDSNRNVVKRVGRRKSFVDQQVVSNGRFRNVTHRGMETARVTDNDIIKGIRLIRMHRAPAGGA